MKDLVDLPDDVIFLIGSRLAPRDAILCRRVSRSWNITFTAKKLSHSLLISHFPRSREARLTTTVAEAKSLGWQSGDLPVELQAELEETNEDKKDWAQIYALVARRYHNLQIARPHALEKIQIEQGPASFKEVAPWSRYLRLDNKRAQFHYPDPAWSYCQEDGLLVYRSPDLRQQDNSPGSSKGGLSSQEPPGSRDTVAVMTHGYTIPGSEFKHPFRVMDLATRHEYEVPFLTSDRIIRRVRLAHGVLIIEWCEQEPYHQLNATEFVHRHYVTAFDVVRERTRADPAAGQTTSSTSASPRNGKAPEGTTWPLDNEHQARRQGAPPPPWTWKITFRSEWKMHFLGLPLDRGDRFMSAHTATHYAVYVWQPIRSDWGEDDPIESLVVWDISQPLDYRPSEDPQGRNKPMVASARNFSLPDGMRGLALHDGDEGGAARQTQGGRGPVIIRRLTWRELDFYGVRQRQTPRLRSIALDARNLYMVEEEHRWAVGKHSALTPPRVHYVKSTGIPIIPGPAAPVRAVLPPLRPEPPPLFPADRPWRSRIPVYTPPRPPHERGSAAAVDEPLPAPVQGPRWVDECGADGRANMSFCWRAQLAEAEHSSGLRPQAMPIVQQAMEWFREAGRAQRCGEETFTAPFEAPGEAGDPPPVSPAFRASLFGGPAPGAVAGSVSSSASASGSTPSGDNGVTISHNGNGTIPSAARTATTTTATGTTSPAVWPGSATPTANSVPFVRGSPSRWPGWAPCWRHEDFPYLTVSEVVDFGAGVRISARHCFMLEYLSVHVRPALCVKGLDAVLPSLQRQGVDVGGSDDDDDDDDDDSSSDYTGTSWGAEQVQFADEMWDQLLAKGCIAGDERWIVGEDKEGMITVARF
ncbi:hypothetical protein NKR23_g8014 [Pleurostoma richardsiae]|uniref:F-box domain-containing protein n=1 Tax=Pleurostoma richardsiae TaxID=41990 RepID=A0AA38RJR6_9PEZI|nr:hypothetical protein NKR23_g8014 [Pleurostoma richardsiae]